MPTKKLFLAAVLGGVVLFVWGWIAHAVLPLYTSSIHKFADEDAVTQAISANATRSGTYYLPLGHHGGEASAEEMKAMEERMAKGPMMFAHVRVGGWSGMGSNLIVEFINDVLSALVVGLLLLTARGLTYGGRILFVLGVAVAVILESRIGQWNWYSAGSDYTFAEIVDLLVGWFLVGLVIAKVLPREPAAA